MEICNVKIQTLHLENKAANHGSVFNRNGNNYLNYNSRSLTFFLLIKGDTFAD